MVRALLALWLGALLTMTPREYLVQHAQAEETVPKEIWINLPVRDVARARDFFTSIGFSLNSRFGNSDASVSLVVGDKEVVVMLFDETIFSSFVGTRVADATEGAQMLVSLGVDSREAVDEMARKADAAGGTVFSEPAEIQGWMYGAGFADPDGHRWNVLYMDMSRMPQQ